MTALMRHAAATTGKTKAVLSTIAPVTESGIVCDSIKETKETCIRNIVFYVGIYPGETIIAVAIEHPSL